MKWATKPTQHYPLHLRRVVTLPWEIKNSIFCKYLVDMDESANELHFKKLPTFEIRLSTSLLCTPSNNKLFIKILSSLLNNMLIVDKHCSDICCDEFPMPQIDRKSNYVKEQWHGKFYLQSVWGNTRCFKHRKYQNLWMNN